MYNDDDDFERLKKAMERTEKKRIKRMMKEVKKNTSCDFYEYHYMNGEVVTVMLPLN